MDQMEQLIQGGPFTESDVVNLVYGFGLPSHRSQQICLHNIRYIAKVPAGLAIAIDMDWFALKQRRDPFRNDRRIGALRILPWTKHIEVPQADAFEAVGLRKGLG